MGTSTGTESKIPHILIVGGGYVGMYTALGLQKRLKGKIKKGQVAITIVDPQSYMTYQPFLPEAAAGNIEPRHVVAPLRRVLRQCRVLSGRITRIDHANRIATFEPAEGPEQAISYDIVVVAAGSISRTLPIPGLAENGIGFKTVGEAIYLRNHVLEQLDLAASADDPEVRQRALTFVFVGGGFAGVEALAELEDMARDACKLYPNIQPDDMRWVLVEAADRILPEVGEEMGAWTVEALSRRGIDVRLETLLSSAKEGRIELSTGDTFESNTLVWTAGVKPNPAITTMTDLPVGPKGHLRATAELTVADAPDAFTAGDIAQVPDVTKPGEYCAPNAQHAVRQAKRLASNIAAYLDGKPLKPYEHKYVGSVASLGLHKGVADVYGIKAKGVIAWFMHRTYHLSRVPTINRKTRVTADWTLALFFPREVVSLGALSRPREEFESATHR